MTADQMDAIKKEQLEKARESFGKINIQLGYGSSPPTGYEKDAVNVFISNRTPTGKAGVSALIKGTDTPIIILDIRKVHDDTLFSKNTAQHEFGHVLAGDPFRKRGSPFQRFFYGITRENQLDKALQRVDDGQGYPAFGINFRRGVIPRRFAAQLSHRDNRPRQ